jgi:iron complex transport system substrate-binding protein
LGDKVVGVSDFSSYPPQARNKTNIGGIFNPNRERITMLQPDLIITQGKHEVMAKLCREQGIRFLAVKIDSLSDIPQAIEFLGKELHAEKKADAVAQKLERELAAIRKKTQDRPKKRVFLTLGHTPGDLMGLMTTGPGTFLNELITIAGGENIFNDVVVDYPNISKEALVMRQPEIIIEVFPEGFTANNRSLLRKDWDRLASLPAVKAGNIHFLSDDYLLIPGIRIAQTAEKLAKIIHPELFE